MHGALLNEEDAAEWLGFSTRTLQLWRLNGRGPAFVKINRNVRYRLEDLELFAADRVRLNTADDGARRTG
jgi:predicted site-specific integrase-resolvase